MSDETAAKVDRMLRKVVSERDGTGNLADVEGYDVAGKTGTAEKIDPTTGKYNHLLYTSSFVGYAPADDPQLLVAVVRRRAHRGFLLRWRRGRPRVRRDHGVRPAKAENPSLSGRGARGSIPTRMTLDELIGSGPGGRVLPPPDGIPAGGTQITSVVQSPGDAGPGSLFCAVRGLRADGHDFAAEAVARGAAALLVERPLDLPVPQVLVDDSRLGMALAAAAIHGHPSRAMAVVGVTGTNGKTTSAFLLHAVLEAAGRRCGLIGTIEARIGGEVVPMHHTTPDAIELQALFARMRDAGDTACAMEVSSHALTQRRVAGTRFAAALFTNLTRDHLDYHPDVEHYYAAKRGLFARPAGEGEDPPGAANLDDEFGRRLARETGALGYAIDAPAEVRPVAGGRARDRHPRHDGHPARAGRDREPPARPLQPGEPLRSYRGGRAAGAAARRARCGHRVGGRRTRSLRGHRGRPALPGDRRLRTHARLARQRPARGPGHRVGRAV